MIARRSHRANRRMIASDDDAPWTAPCVRPASCSTRRYRPRRYRVERARHVRRVRAEIAVVPGRHEREPRRLRAHARLHLGDFVGRELVLIVEQIIDAQADEVRIVDGEAAEERAPPQRVLAVCQATARRREVGELVPSSERRVDRLRAIVRQLHDALRHQRHGHAHSAPTCRANSLRGVEKLDEARVVVRRRQVPVDGVHVAFDGPLRDGGNVDVARLVPRLARQRADRGRRDAARREAREEEVAGSALEHCDPA